MPTHPHSLSARFRVPLFLLFLMLFFILPLIFYANWSQSDLAASSVEVAGEANGVSYPLFLPLLIKNNETTGQ